jgi:hypothetical protein
MPRLGELFNALRNAAETQLANNITLFRWEVQHLPGD